MPQGSLIRALSLFERSGQSRSPLDLMKPSAGHARRIYFGRRKRILFLFFSFLSLYHTPFLDSARQLKLLFCDFWVLP